MMVAAAVAALICANTGAFQWYENVLDFHLGIYVRGSSPDGIFIGLTIEEWVNQVFMTLFFLCVGLEIKYELFVGELQDIRKALLPILAACGGVIVPIIIYTCFNFGTEHAKGFGIPMATDIAFAIGVLSLVGKGVPRSLKVFLQTLAIADDILAIVVIAVFYGKTPSLMWLLIAAGVVVCLILLNRFHVFSLVPYLLLGVALWFCIYFSGVESTIAGVILAFTIPTKSQIDPRVFGKWTIAKVLEAKDRFLPGEPMLAQQEYTEAVNSINKVSNHVQPPLTKLDSALSPWSTFVILPVFAFFNAGIRLVDANLVTVVLNPVTLGVFFGLFIGKPIGISLASFACIKSKLSPLPTGCNWKHMIGAGMLGGVGFTMAIYVANLSFFGPEAAEVTMIAKAAILCASVTSAVCGVLFLKAAIRHEERGGAVFADLEEDETKRDIEELSEISEDEMAEQKEQNSPLVLTNRTGDVLDDSELENALMSFSNDVSWFEDDYFGADDDDDLL